MASFPLSNFHDLNEETWPKVLSGINSSIKAVEDDIPDVTGLQTKTLATPVTIGGEQYSTVEDTLHAIEAVLNG